MYIQIFFISAATFVATNAINVAVVEYYPVNATIIPDITERLTQNIKNYIEIIDSIPNIDLIIFPESVLNTGTVASKLSTPVTIGDNPCLQENSKYPNFMHNLSCVANTKHLTIIINTIENEPCKEHDTTSKNCKLYGNRFYNCDIVFGPGGVIIARYRKYNLFGEYDLDTPDKVDHTIFEVNGKKIGVFTCFDIMFKTPPEELIELGVKNIAFPTMWFSELPFLTALQTQQMWAHEHDVTLYAAGANNPKVGSGGSGIYNGKNGPAIYDIIAEGGTRFYVEDNAITDEDDNIDVLAKSMDGFFLRKDNLKPYQSVLLDVHNSSQQFYEVCHDSFCCNFTLKVSYNTSLIGDSYIYHLVAFSGIRSFGGVRNGGLDICGVVACFGDEPESCGERFSNYEQVVWPVEFQQLEIHAEFIDNGNRTEFPNSLLSSIRPIPPDQTTWIRNNRQLNKTAKVVERIWILNKPQNRLMTFAIFGRNFALDTKPSEKPSSGVVFNISSCLFVMIVSIMQQF